MLGRTVKEQRCDWGTELLFYYTCTTLFHHSNSNHVLFLIFVATFYQKFHHQHNFQKNNFNFIYHVCTCMWMYIHSFFLSTLKKFFFVLMINYYATYTSIILVIYSQLNLFPSWFNFLFLLFISNVIYLSFFFTFDIVYLSFHLKKFLFTTNPHVHFWLF